MSWVKTSCPWYIRRSRLRSQQHASLGTHVQVDDTSPALHHLDNIELTEVVPPLNGTALARSEVLPICQSGPLQ
jgi:hypothetical protein